MSERTYSIVDEAKMIADAEMVLRKKNRRFRIVSKIKSRNHKNWTYIPVAEMEKTGEKWNACL